MQKQQTRRQLIKTAGLGTAAFLAGHSILAPDRLFAQNQPAPVAAARTTIKVGMASYSFRKFNLEQALAMTKQVGLKYIAFKSVHLPLESTQAEIEAAVAKVKEAGLELYGGGVIYMKNQDEVNRAFDYAKFAGMKVIIGAPQPELLPLVNKKVQQYDIKVAIHNHGPGDKTYPTPDSAYEKIKDLDKRIGLCNDVGHTFRAGVDPAQSAEQLGDRLFDVHIKDVLVGEGGKQKAKETEVGRGSIDIPKFLRTLVKIKYAGVVAFEYEKDSDGFIAGLAESVGYVKGVLAAIS